VKPSVSQVDEIITEQDDQEQQDQEQDDDTEYVIADMELCDGKLEDKLRKLNKNHKTKVAELSMD